MKNWKRILSVLLAVLLLCTSMSMAAVAEIEGASGEEDTEAIEILLEDDAQGSDGEAVGEDSERPLYEIDGTYQESASSGLESDGEVGQALLAPEPEPEEEAPQANDASDFVITDGVLVKYVGNGGDVVIPSGVTIIGASAFRGCESITSVVIPSGVVTIKNAAFYECVNLVSVSFPEGLVSIEEYAFIWDESLTSITLPSTVNTIGEAAFANCYSLISANIPQGVTYIPEALFYCCTSLVTVSVPNGIIGIGNKGFYRCYRLTGFTLPTALISIGSDAFYACDSLSSFSVPASVTSIGASAFSACGSLVTISVSSSNQNYTSVNGVLYNKKTHELICCPGAKASVSIPSGTTGIGDWAFSFCRDLSSITIPTSVTRIGEGAFCGCESLTEMTIPENVTSIGAQAFYSCTGLTSLTIYATKISIEDNAFENADPLIIAFEGYDAYSWAEDHGLSVIGITSAMDPAKLSQTSVTLKVNKTATLKISGLAGRPVTWSTSNQSVATVKSGKITAKNGGKCTITAQIKNGKKLTCTVTVSDKLAISKKSMTISSIDSATLKLTGLEGRTVTWSTSNSGVVKLVKGKGANATIKGVKPGKAVISAQIKGGKALKCTVKVVNPLTVTKAKFLSTGSKEKKLQLILNNQSNKRIDFIKLQIIQKDISGKKLKGPYSYYYFSNLAIKPHGSHKGTCGVHKKTEKVQFKILEVEFSDGTKWKP